MALNTAHEGYEYQDLLTAFFILKEIINENDSSFQIDVKDYPDDKFDDLTITNRNGVFKKQFKYSNEATNKTVEKKIFSTKTSYNLRLLDLFRSWIATKNNDIRLCLAWNEATDDLVNFLKVSSKSKTFDSFDTKIFEVDVDRLWINGQTPDNSWSKFEEESRNINRNDFAQFCDAFVIEMEFPKMGNALDFVGELENIVIEQIQRLGIGEYPNNKTKPKDFAFGLIKLITRCRGNGITISTNDIFRQLNIITNFGSIEQVFPIDDKKNIIVKSSINEFITFLEVNQKIILKGEPGSGKSWFVQNLQHELKNKNYKVIKHYCYTELKDSFSKERITLNVFYGNLIKDILDAFPFLKNEKKQRFASNLTELNTLLKSIQEQTILIIDGLDHIDRVFAFSQADLTLNDIAIIEAISQLEFSDNVKVILASQPIAEIDAFSNYSHFSIPKWENDNVLAYFSKNNIDDVEFSENSKLSTLLTEKSAGNPLYLNYLVEEIKNINPLSIEAINNLPSYSFNIKEYYEYLLKKLNFDAIVPQVLSGVNFSLSKSELKEITNQGKNVDNAISTLKPILNEKTSTGGYIIYHESFRRFILEKLQNDEVNIEKAIFQPIIQWFEGKGFFEFPKAYRFYFQLLYNIGKFDKIVEYLKVDFVVESIYYGYSFEAVLNNYRLMAKSAIHQKDLPKIVLANEINKVLSSTEDEYYNKLELYFSALGHLRGFKSVSDYLVFDEKPTLPLGAGIRICYLCSQYNEPTYWDLYFDYFEQGNSIELSDFKYYVKGILIFKDTDCLIGMAEKIYSEYPDYMPVFQKELLNHSEQTYIDELKIRSNFIDDIFHYIKPNAKNDLLELANQILAITHCSDKELILIESFFDKISQSIDNEALIISIIDLFKTKNWFYNWLIYYIKINIIRKKDDYSYYEVLEAFKYLVYDTEPSKGEPRTCDLYSLQDYISSSIEEGLKFIKTTDEWNEIIDLVVKASDETGTSIQRSLSGAIPMDKLFIILDNSANENNRNKIIQTFEQLIDDKKDYYLHSYITDFHFILSKQYSLNQEKNKAEVAFKKGGIFLIGYTMRRDRTLEDTLYAIEKYAKVDEIKGKEYIRQLKSLVDSVVEHTDGKDTYWFPVEWYQEYLKIDFKEASLYLLSQTKKATYNWEYEKQLQDLLIKSNVNPFIEAFIFLTFPIEASEKFLAYGLSLIDKVAQNDTRITNILLQNIIERTENERNQELSADLLSKYNEVLKLNNLEEFQKKHRENKRNEIFDKKSPVELIKSNTISRKEFSDMTIQELTEYCNTYKLREIDVVSLSYKFDEFTTLTPEIENIITTIVRKYEEYPKDENININVLFNKENGVSAYFWVSKFVSERDDWYKNLVNIEAFKKAYSLNPKLTIDALTKLSSIFIETQGYIRGVSSGLINALVEVGYEQDIIERMWENLYKATDFRLPVKEQVSWESILTDDLTMNIEEIFICLLFTRFNSNTTERNHWTLAGLSYFYEKHPEKMIKPTKWFLQNTEHFLITNLILILETLYDIHISNPTYCQNFTEELNQLVPSKFYLINDIVGNIFSKNIVSIQHKINLFIPAEQELVKDFASLNYRNEILHYQGFDFEGVVGKYKNSFLQKYRKDFEFLGNLSIEQYVKNIYPANYLIELINEHLCEDFENCYNQNDLYEVLKIDYKTIVAQTLSYTKRPADILKPSQIKSEWEKREIIKNEWVRLGYYEYELFGKNFGKNQQHIRVWEGIVFSNEIEKTIPFSRFRLYPKHLWNNIQIKEYDEFVCVSLIQQWDTLEDYKILWLKPVLIKKLGLVIEKYTEGLCAKNEDGEIVLKYNHWSSNYVGNGDIARITDEIPRLEGGELLCRKDIFEKLCKIFPLQTPNSYIFKI